MPLNRMAQANVLAALKEGSDQYGEQQKANAKESQAKLEAFLKGKSQDEELERIGRAQREGLLQPGGSIKVGDTQLGQDAYAHYAAQGPQQANRFNKYAAGVYKPIQDQVDAAKATLDSLNQKNQAGDKLALINEAKLAAGSGGSRAIKSIMDSLTGGKTAAMDIQGAVNYLNNTPNVPVMQDAQRDAIRESVFGRMGQVHQSHQQAKSSLLRQGPLLAPMSDSASLAKSYTDPVDQNLSALDKMQEEYQKARQGAPNPISTPSIADPNPTMVDKLKSFFHGSGQKPQGQGLMRVKNVQSGQMGTIDPMNPQDAADLKAGKYQQVQ